MNNKDKKFVKNNSKKLAEYGINLIYESMGQKDEMKLVELMNIILSLYISACANVMRMIAAITEDSNINVEVENYIMKLFRSIPDGKAEIEGINEH